MKIIEKIKSFKFNLGTGAGTVLISLILSAGFALGGYFIGSGLYQSIAKRTVTVKGLAEQNVAADMAIWNININRVGGDLAALQTGVDSDIDKIKRFLKSSGFSEEDIQNSRIQVRDKSTGYSDGESKSQKNEGRYVIETGVIVRSANVKLVDFVSRKLGELVRQGITITEDYSGPIYVFNGLNDIKMSMIEQATKNATDAGRQFAKDAGAKLGRIQSANQGVFSIESRDPTDRWSNDEKQSIDKKVRVVSTITFYLR
ncbi:MAG: SIMPL domain-containing protein [Rickettsiales bacterium]|jgi:hypothetical protein|nr:SIMPL domain-containing protein [Rickettsiales bacterium]